MPEPSSLISRSITPIRPEIDYQPGDFLAAPQTGRLAPPEIGIGSELSDLQPDPEVTLLAALKPSISDPELLNPASFNQTLAEVDQRITEWQKNAPGKIRDMLDAASQVLAKLQANKEALRMMRGALHTA